MELSRAIDAALAVTLASGFIKPVVFVHIDWPDNPVWVHSNTGEIEWNGQIWAGVGDLGSLTIPEEGEGIVPSEARLTIMGDAETALDESARQDVRGRVVSIWVGSTETPGGTDLVGEPLDAFSGTVDVPDYEDLERGLTAAFAIDVATGPGARSGAQIVHSDEDQQARFPGDTLFRRVSHAEKWRTNPPQFPA
ncbi:hypothetical protein [uncultured Tateyamaria sp.]|uniref:hypothetical protein n=1 Tax=uncultured Tateyamaria sp. TaxID=455651 RepID=UPI002616F296|nr:hypothetical protein [uncultured Tateyamaria sp.]